MTFDSTTPPSQSEPPPEPTPPQLERFFEDMAKMPESGPKRWAWWHEMKLRHPWLIRFFPLAAAATLGASVCWAVCGLERSVVDTGIVESRR